MRKDKGYHPQDFYRSYLEDVLAQHQEGLSGEELQTLARKDIEKANVLNEFDWRIHPSTKKPRWYQISENNISNNPGGWCDRFRASDNMFYPDKHLLDLYGIKCESTKIFNEVQIYNSNVGVSEKRIDLSKKIKEGVLKISKEVRRRSRDRDLVLAALGKNRDEHGGVCTCIVCDFKDDVRIGEVMQVHHIIPIANHSENGEDKTIEEALPFTAVVCPNCHSRMGKTGLLDPNKYKEFISSLL